MDIRLIGAPIFYGCDNPGTELATKKLRELDIVYKLESYGHKVNDIGDILVPYVPEEEKFKLSNNMKYLEPIINTNKKLAYEVEQSLKEGEFPLILGGDHSIGIGAIAGVSNHYKNIGVIWIDAHADINTDITSSSKNVHGMPLAIAMGIGHESLTSINKNRVKVNPKNVFHLGGRDFDKGEIELIDKIDSNFYTNKDLRREGIDNIINDIIEKIEKSNLDAVHISLDIDFIDYEYVPGTGTRVKEGFTVEETKHILKRLSSISIIKSIDIVELNPRLDIKDTTANIVIELIDSLFKSKTNELQEDFYNVEYI